MPEGSFGERLRRERELRGVTLEEIAAATKIGTRHLRSLENEQFKNLPGGIFNKGFVRAYARFLGIDEEQAVTDYLAACGEPEQNGVEINASQLIAQRKEVEAQTRAASKRAKELHSIQSGDPSGFPWLALLGLALIGLIAWGGREWYLKHKAEQQTAPQVVQQAPIENQAPSPIQDQSAVGQTNTTTGGASPSPTATQNANIGSSASQASSAKQSTPPVASKPNDSNPSEKTVQPDVTVSQPAPKPPNPALAKVVAPGNFVVSIHARQRTWVSIIADGKQVMSGELEPSSKRDVQAHDSITVKTGNAGGTDIAFNGKPLPALGADSEVRTITVSADGTVQ